ncbi:hypothetical protein ACLMJK_002556 [Lecanora helva]
MSGGVVDYPRQSPGPHGKTDRAGSAVNGSLGALGDDEDMSLDHVGELLPDRFNIEHIALTFINALSIQASQDFNAPMSSYMYMDLDRPDIPVRLTMNRAIGANPVRLVRKHLIWCLRYLPLEEFNYPSIWGFNFIAKFRGQNLYFGTLDNRNRQFHTLDMKNENLNNGSVILQNKRAGSELKLNASSIPLSAVGLGDAQIDVDFPPFAGDLLPQVEVFRNIIEFIYKLAPRSKTEMMRNVSLSDTLSVWIFIMYYDDTRTGETLQVHHIIGLLRLLAQRYIFQHIYEEQVFRLTFNGQPFAAGCVTKADESRRWCAGMAGITHSLSPNRTQDLVDDLISSS